ncbi:formylglycine-generating enzyme family protein [Microbacterium sp.]|uniref:formylglycine-generating enzyme family protein n=1 Tax=Microbacterium sp. TaxID=51671 RepID=UPI000B1A86A5|nr:formylglycine-generating enzyme family protein [Microbacterium sp.]MBN9189682.1 formylglycine-generating enzyme family protein [Microbacterium sp.]MBN9193900.1 formylglycine-generating enzyme family protein [Microbacterium sp.]
MDTSTDATGGSCGAGCTCGAPSRGVFVELGTRVPPPAVLAGGVHDLEQVAIPAGTFVMGDASGDENRGDGESPRHEVSLDAFQIDATSVTNDAFARFVAATGYVTEAESFGFSAVFHLLLRAPDADVMGSVAAAPWWLGVRGADWRHPGGRDSDLDGLGDHPVTHVSWNDAVAYAEWAGRRLPTEAEWEYASRGGLVAAKYPWGDEEVDAGGWRANIWQGEFPVTNTVDDGYLGTAPVRSFTPNGYGLWQTVGNVWEWCADWFSPGYYRASPASDPRGPASGSGRVMRGGSYLCHISYCNRYRNSARTSNTPDSSMGNAGFRTAATVVAHQEISHAGDAASRIELPVWDRAASA